MTPYGSSWGNGNGYSSQYGGHNSHASHTQPSMAGGMPASYPQLNFTTSPFYHVEAQITPTQECQRKISSKSKRRSQTYSKALAMPNHRHTISISLRLSDKPLLQRCVDDASYRVMLFCAGSDPNGIQHVAFPPQTEIKVNGGELKANTRGLKGKPGTTKPVDITSALRLKSTYQNNIDFTFALTKHVSRGVVRVSSVMIFVEDTILTFLLRNFTWQ